MQKRSLFAVQVMVTGSLLAGAVVAQATPMLSLEDGNSVATFDLMSQDGQNSWLVDGVNHLSKQWFWYRAGNMTREQSIDSISRSLMFLADTNPFTDNRLDTLAVLYTDPNQQFQVELGLRLRGGAAGQGTADLAEQISIRNLTNSPLEFHFFQYVDFNLDGSAEGDMTAFAADNTVIHYKPGGSYVSETVITPRSSHHDTQLMPMLLNGLNDALPTTLSDANGAGPGDVAWAFEWDVVIAPGGEFQISKDKQIVPDPATLSLLAMGGLAFIRRRRA